MNKILARREESVRLSEIIVTLAMRHKWDEKNESTWSQEEIDQAAAHIETYAEETAVEYNEATPHIWNAIKRMLLRRFMGIMNIRLEDLSTETLLTLDLECGGFLQLKAPVPKDYSDEEDDAALMPSDDNNEGDD